MSAMPSMVFVHLEAKFSSGLISLTEATPDFLCGTTVNNPLPYLFVRIPEEDTNQ